MFLPFCDENAEIIKIEHSKWRNRKQNAILTRCIFITEVIPRPNHYCSSMNAVLRFTYTYTVGKGKVECGIPRQWHMEALKQECGKWVNTFRQYGTSLIHFSSILKTTKTGLGQGLGQPHFFFKGVWGHGGIDWVPFNIPEKLSN